MKGKKAPVFLWFLLVMGQASSILSGQPFRWPESGKALFESVEDQIQWPSYRGYLASGYIDNAGLPDSFDVETGYHVRWTVEIPGLGLSCPVIWEDHIYVTSAVSTEDNAGLETGIFGDIAPVNDSSVHSWRVYCIDKKTGGIIWEKEAHRGVPAVMRHPKSTHANTTITTDGLHVVAFFGSEGLYCYDSRGRLLWSRDFGLIRSAWNVVPSAEWEFSSSPLIFGNRLILQADALNRSWVAVLDVESGETVWEKDRDEISGWCTPNIYFDGTKARVAVNGYRHRGAYDLETGEEIWSMEGGGDIPIPTPLVWKDLVFFNSAHGRNAPLMAIRNSARGKLLYPGTTGEPVTGVAWFHEREGAYMTVPLVYDSLLYMLRWNGNLNCFRARTGEKLYGETVYPASFIASPVAADGKIYLVAESGELYIVTAGPEYRLLRKINLGEPSLVTPAISPGIMVLRTQSRLIGVSSK
jgi:outer membrane protein assembly factor BamB